MCASLAERSRGWRRSTTGTKLFGGGSLSSAELAYLFGGRHVRDNSSEILVDAEYKVARVLCTGKPRRSKMLHEHQAHLNSDVECRLSHRGRLFRPFRADVSLCSLSQGVALG